MRGVAQIGRAFAWGAKGRRGGTGHPDQEIKMNKQKDWVSKLKEVKGLPKVTEITGKMSKRWGIGTVAIPAPIEVDEAMKTVPKGKVITINEIREAIAKKHKASIGCPLTCGIFAWIAAHAAEQERQEGKADITPYWRTLKTGGFLNEKYPGGGESQKKLSEKEGHKVAQKGKKYVVLEYEKSLIKFS